MVFIETSLFSRLLPDYLSDDEYRALQGHLVESPDSGAVIRGSGGVRKVRWGTGGKGKSGGVRIIYYWITADDQILFLTIYGKSKKADLSAGELKRVMRLIEEIYG